LNDDIFDFEECNSIEAISYSNFPQHSLHRNMPRSKTHTWQVPEKYPMTSSPQQPVQYEPSSWHNKQRISLYDVLRVSQLSIRISIHSKTLTPIPLTKEKYLT
jgi:hypothetical protein